MLSEIQCSIRSPLPATFRFLKMSGELSVKQRHKQLCICVPSEGASPRTCAISAKFVQVNNAAQHSLVIQGKESI